VAHHDCDRTEHRAPLKLTEGLTSASRRFVSRANSAAARATAYNACNLVRRRFCASVRGKPSYFCVSSTARSRAEAVSTWARAVLLGLTHPLWPAKEMRALHGGHRIVPMG
jgi:hypothetical protein